MLQGGVLRFAILKLCHSLLFMLVSVQYQPHRHVAIFSQGLHALRTRSQASGRKTVNPLRIMSNINDDATIANAIANAATDSTTATATGTADGHAANPLGFQQ